VAHIYAWAGILTHAIPVSRAMAVGPFQLGWQKIRSPIPRGLSIGPSLTFARADTPVLDVGGDGAECHGLVVSALPGHRRVDETPHRPQIKTQPSGMQVHVLAAHCADAGRTVDRRGRRACLLKGLPHEEIAPRCVGRRPAR
jgi:hypothetical protein